MCGASRHWANIMFRKKWSGWLGGSGWPRLTVTALPTTFPLIVALTAAAGLASLPTTSVARSARSGGSRVG